MRNNSDDISHRSQYRIPSLFELFFGKLANWSRARFRSRREGRLGKVRSALRKKAHLEVLEPRLLLSADAYGVATVDGLVNDAIGNDPGLIGVPVHIQALEVEIVGPGLNFAASNGLSLTFGML